ncbi:hypothetical protein AVEN_41975-1 [Araneus ventricosus]|uniref:Uncharacterized protein n=2 Tax=Araneus ventricosus TaxID=182803 RepID=A0A4Y2U2D3_ARAVE|nr:hypothetical protein AVEN_33270-1 [Araneus ventricosus]GBO06752.1 hypothetical protein AVEN_41975-1 [Araneus ventricosus]
MHKISLTSRVPSSNKHPINENVTEKSVKKQKTSEPSAKRRKCPLTIKEMFARKSPVTPSIPSAPSASYQVVHPPPSQIPNPPPYYQSANPNYVYQPPANPDYKY